MTAIGDYSDVLNDNMIAAWPRVAAALEGLDCALMGGTAVAMVLRHRHSHDLDFMTLQPFDSRAVAAKLLSSAARAAYKDDDRPHIAKVAFDGVPVTIMRDLRGFVEGHATQLAAPSVVDGIAVGSVPDLMASKLEVIQHRRQGRDYIDIAAMDRAGACTIEDGATFHHPGGLIVHSPMGKALFGATMSKLCNDNRGGAVSHGFRASFRSWTAEAGVARDVAEICLGHTVHGVEGASQRSDMLERRRVVMRRWADYIAPRPLPEPRQGAPRTTDEALDMAAHRYGDDWARPSQLAHINKARPLERDSLALPWHR